MSITYNFFVSLAIKVLGAIISVISPEIRKLVEKVVNELYEEARKTSNPWDDFFVKLLAAILGVKLEEEE